VKSLGGNRSGELLDYVEGDHRHDSSLDWQRRRDRDTDTEVSEPCCEEKRDSTLPADERDTADREQRGKGEETDGRQPDDDERREGDATERCRCSPDIDQ